MMGTLSFFNIFFALTQSFLNFFSSLIYEWVLTHFFQGTHTFLHISFPFTHGWVSALSHKCISDCFPRHTIHVTHVKEWRLVLISRTWGVSASLRWEWVRSHMWISECHVTPMSEWALLMSLNSCHTYEWESVCLDVTHTSAWVLLFNSTARHSPELVFKRTAALLDTGILFPFEERNFTSLFPVSERIFS